MIDVPAQTVGFQITSPTEIPDNRDGGTRTLQPGYYVARPQLRENMTLYYVYLADEHYVAQGYSLVHPIMRVTDEGNVRFGMS